MSGILTREEKVLMAYRLLVDSIQGDDTNSSLKDQDIQSVIFKPLEACELLEAYLMKFRLLPKQQQLHVLFPRSFPTPDNARKLNLRLSNTN